MTAPRASMTADAGTLVAGSVLFALTAIAWFLVLRESSSMSMPGPGTSPSAAEGVAFTLQWGVMMAAMMLPSAAPMILLYGTVSRRLRAQGDRAIPVALFVAVYLFLWLLVGIPVYGGYVAVASLAARSPSFAGAIPYAVAGVLVAAGIYQLTDVKRACLRYCESPLEFLMRRWRSGYAATTKLAARHASYCIGCCWGLMVILIAAGAMNIAWVLAIAAVVFAEKVLPRGWQTARAVGVGLIALGLAVAVRPSLAIALRGNPEPMHHEMSDAGEARR